MDTNNEKLKLKGINPTQPRELSSEGGKQIKEKSKNMRRPKSGKSL